MVAFDKPDSQAQPISFANEFLMDTFAYIKFPSNLQYWWKFGTKNEYVFGDLSMMLWFRYNRFRGSFWRTY